MFNSWIKELFDISSSDLGKTPTNVRVENWMENLNTTTQHTPSNVVISQVTHLNFQDSVQVNDSASNVGSVVSESNLLEVANRASNLQDLVALPNRTPTYYNIADFPTYSRLISLPDTKYSHIIVEGVHQYFVIVGDVILSVDPSVKNYFV
jgi:hypothetical protein